LVILDITGVRKVHDAALMPVVAHLAVTMVVVSTRLLLEVVRCPVDTNDIINILLSVEPVLV
jgi:hypothetical protein